MSVSLKPVVAFLGPVTSYTHQATLQRFPPQKFELLPVISIKDVFDATQSGRAEYGVVPFENSTNGSVVFTLDQFADRDTSYPDLSVCAEIYQEVHHCLLGRAPALAPSSSEAAEPVPSATVAAVVSQPLAGLTHIKRIYSHPQAWGQCVNFFRQHLRGIETIDVSSTSRAAELAAEDATGTSAAVSSALAGELQGLDFLARNIEDRGDNTTRFFVLRKTPAVTAASAAAGVSSEPADRSKTKSLLSFTVPHRSPGALADVLECFRRGGLNLTSIDSRPSLVEPFQYVFFVEFEGHRYEDPEDKVSSVLESVARVAEKWRWLGSWVSVRW
ncbi:prephenate dehydratase [Xylariales sp. PMI_506]|nr:prephenate dehydratase [Xylariales sp. PMI_506]